jgi:hypothetical protein
MDTLCCLILETLIVEEWFQVVGKGKFTLIPQLESQDLDLYPFVQENVGIVPHLAPKETWLKAAKATKFDALVSRIDPGIW